MKSYIYFYSWQWCRVQMKEKPYTAMLLSMELGSGRWGEREVKEFVNGQTI